MTPFGTYWDVTATENKVPFHHGCLSMYLWSHFFVDHFQVRTMLYSANPIDMYVGVTSWAIIYPLDVLVSLETWQSFIYQSMQR